MLKLKKQRTNKYKFANREFPESEFIPYKYFWNDHTIITKDESMLQVIKLSGYSFETADDEDVDIRKSIRNLLFKGIGAGQIALYFHTVRRKQSVFSADEEVNMPRGFSSYMEKEWYSKHISHESFVNELYITIIRKKSKGGLGMVEGLMETLQQLILLLQVLLFS